jgi:hypothetical protein
VDRIGAAVAGRAMAMVREEQLLSVATGTPPGGERGE